MELNSEFDIEAPIEVVWAALSDLERVAVCVPGFSLQEGGPERCAGTMKVKIGAVTMNYRGMVELLERDDTQRSAAMRVSGRELRGQGTVQATVSSRVEADGERTHVTMLTDLAVTGRVAQFGRGMIGDVTERLMTQFARSLESKLADQPQASSSSGSEQTGQPPRAVPSVPVADGAAPVDITGIVAGPVARRAVPVAVGLVAAVLVIRWARR